MLPHPSKVSPGLRLNSFPRTDETVSKNADSDLKKHSKTDTTFKTPLSLVKKGSYISGEFLNPLTEEKMKGLFDFINTKSKMDKNKQIKNKLKK